MISARPLSRFSLVCYPRKKTVVVIDNASVHTSEEFEECLPRWKKQGLIIKYLSTYSPELNLIAPVSPIFKAVREKRCTAWYTLAKRSPTAPESALARDSEPSNGDTRGGLPSPPLASPLET